MCMLGDRVEVRSLRISGCACAALEDHPVSMRSTEAAAHHVATLWIGTLALPRGG